jgi:hypothetical protein
MPVTNKGSQDFEKKTCKELSLLKESVSNFSLYPFSYLELVDLLILKLGISAR